MKRSLALLALLASCSVDLQIPDDANITCENDDDCPSGFICDVRSQCRSPEVAARGLPGFDISPPAVTIGESGTPTTVNVRLTAQPSAPVTVVLAADDGTEAFVSKNILTFTPEDYSVAQAVIITGERDCLADGPITSHVVISPAQSQDADYSGLDAPDIDVVTNDDVPSAGIVVTPTTGLETTESGNVTQFSVVVACKPTADVHFTLASSDDSEGAITTSELTFTTDNWAVPRLINVAGKGDCATDGDVPFTIDLGTVDSADPLYTGMDPANVTIINRDVAFGRVNVSPNTGLRTSEALEQTTFSVVLTCAPSANVTVPIASADTGEGSLSGVTNLVFTPDNWNDPQSVIVTGVNDDYDDGNVPYMVTTSLLVSADGDFNGLDPIDVALTNDDNDTASISVSNQTGLHTTEAAGTAQFTITLGAAPLSPVSISILSTNTAEGSVVAGPLVINTNAPFNVTITGVDESFDDGNQSYQILLGDIVSADPAFNGMAVPDIAVTNDDNDAAGILRWENAIYTTEAGGTDDVRYSLTSRPTADVTCTLDDAGDLDEIRIGATGTATMTFTSGGTGDWNTIHSVQVTGLADAVPNDLGSALVSITCTSADPLYNRSTTTEAYNLETATVKRIFTTAAVYAANQVAPTAADALCEAAEPVAGTWKALIVSAAAGNRREACLTAGCNWVLTPNTVYVWHDLQGVLGVTNGSAVFTSVVDGVPISTDSGYWSGMDPAMQTLNTCQGWTNTSFSASGNVGGYYQRNSMMRTFSAFSAECNRSLPLVCVQQ